MGPLPQLTPLTQFDPGCLNLQTQLCTNVMLVMKRPIIFHTLHSSDLNTNLCNSFCSLSNSFCRSTIIVSIYMPISESSLSMSMMIIWWSNQYILFCIINKENEELKTRKSSEQKSIQIMSWEIEKIFYIVVYNIKVSIMFCISKCK